MTESIFRFENSGDTIANRTAADLIEFNLKTSTKPDGTARLVSPSFRMNRDINFHPNPRKTGDPIQDSLLGVLDVEVAGYFVDNLNTLGPKNLFNWMIQDGTSDDFSFGRFGLDLTSFDGLLSLTPTTTVGYILYDIDVEDIEDPRGQVPFVARFYRNGEYTVVP